MSVRVFLLLSAVLLTQAQEADLPASFARCRRRDDDFDQCLVGAVQGALRQMGAGIPELGFPPLEPFAVGDIQIPRSPGDISLDIHFSDMLAHGFTQARINHIHPDLDNSRIEIDAAAPYLLFEANYKMAGEILGQPVRGEGRCYLEYINAQGIMLPRGNRLSRGADNYLDVTTYYLDVVSVENLHVNFQHVDPDPQRSAALNKYLNENSHELWTNMRPEWSRQFSLLLKDLSNVIFNKVPLNKIFLDD